VKGIAVLQDLIFAIKEAVREWKRRTRLRHRRASIKDPFTN
jgi:hypothetical protein